MTGWWSRYAPPHRQPWPEDQPLRLRQHAPARHAAAPKAVAGEGRLRAEPQGMRLRLVDGRPVPALTAQFLAWLTAGWAAEGPTALCPGWAKASWHVSQAVRAWLTAHNRRVQQEGGLSHRGVRLAKPESLGEPHCAQKGPWPAGHCRTGSEVGGGRMEASALCL